MTTKSAFLILFLSKKGVTVMYEEILEEIEQNKLKSVKEKLVEMLVPDIADLLEQIESPKDLLKVFKILPKDKGAEVLVISKVIYKKNLLTH